MVQVEGLSQYGCPINMTYVSSVHYAEKRCALQLTYGATAGLSLVEIAVGWKKKAGEETMIGRRDSGSGEPENWGSLHRHADPYSASIRWTVDAR
jgi:hypothetical protein